MPYGSVGGVIAKIPENLFAIAQVSITHPTPAATISVVGTGDDDLNPANGGFVPVLNHYSQTLVRGSQFTVLADGRVQVNVAGELTITGYADLAHTNNGATAGVVFAIERNAATIYSPRTVHTKLPNNGDIGNVCGVGTLSAEAGDIIGIAVASDSTGDVSIRASGLVFEYKAL